jgi:hypothetical protein
MITAQVCSPVIGTGLGLFSNTPDAYRARLVDIPGVEVLSDNTGGNAPITPNVAVFTCIFTPTAFDAVLADTENYLVISWSDNG